MGRRSSKLSFRDLLLEATDRLRAAGSSTARLDAELMLVEASGISREAIIRDPAAPPAESVVARYRHFIDRRERREPVAYILGRREFWSLDLRVTRSVLIPRPETEILVCETLRRLPAGGLRLLDLGTGSGNVALALATERDDLSVVATDISEKAVRIARENAARFGLESRVAFVLADWLEPFQAVESFDAVVSNPPYVRVRDWDTLDRQTFSYEPARSLLAGEDGLAAYRTIAEAAHRILRPSGWLVMEIGMDQAGDVRDCLWATGRYGPVEVARDLAGRDRVVAVRRNS